MMRPALRLILFMMLTLILSAASVGPFVSVARADIPPHNPGGPRHSAGTPAADETINTTYLMYVWLGCSLLSFIVTWVLSHSGRTAIQYSASPSSASPAGTAPPAGMRARDKGKLKLTWRTFILPLVWLPLPCMFVVTALGASTPLVFQPRKAVTPSEIVGYSQKRNDPGWLASSNDMADLSSSISISASYAAVGLMSLNVCLLLLLGVQAFAGRDPDPQDADADGNAARAGAGADPDPNSASNAASTATSTSPPQSLP